MVRHPAIRDYLYVSRTRVERLAASLPPKALARLTSVNLKLGPVSGGVSLSPDEKKVLVEAVSEVEPEIRKAFRIRTTNDRPLEPGMWVEGVSLRMAYGTPRGISTNLEAALFSSVEERRRILLVGSASGLLDRSHASAQDPSDGMSNPQSIGDLLRAARGPAWASQPVTRREARSLHAHPIENLHYSLVASSGLHPVTFLAMVTQESADGDLVNIVAQPLFVALEPPA